MARQPRDRGRKGQHGKRAEPQRICAFDSEPLRRRATGRLSVRASLERAAQSGCSLFRRSDSVWIRFRSVRGQIPWRRDRVRRRLALYDGENVVGGLGASGDTLCADHNIAWRVRQALGLDKVPAGVGPDHNDEIIYDLTPDKSSASGYGHALCKGKEPEIAEQIHAGFVPRWAKVTK